MTKVQPLSSAFLTADPNELMRIHEPSVNLCVWQRSVAAPMVRFIDRVIAPMALRREITSAPQDPDLDLLLRDFRAEEGLDLFRADIKALVQRYVALTDAKRISVKLESFGGTLCERFHTDWVGLRLICTYAGPGTQWLANEDVDRNKLGLGAGGRPGETSGLIRPGAAIGVLARFAVGLMKGSKWPGNRDGGLVHRSPTVTEKTVRRLLLKIEGTTGA